MSTNGKTKYIFAANSSAWGRTLLQRQNTESAVYDTILSLADGGTAAENIALAVTSGSATVEQTLAVGIIPTWYVDEPEKYNSPSDNFYIHSLTSDFTGTVGTFDPICAAVGGYWSAVGTQEDTNIATMNSQYEGVNISDSELVKGVVPTSFTGPTYTDGSIYPTYTQNNHIIINTPVVTQNITNFFLEHVLEYDENSETAHVIKAHQCKLLRNALYYGTDSNTYSTMATTISLPLNPVETSMVNSGVTSEYALVDSEYNISYSTYERITERLISRKRTSGDTQLSKNLKQIENLLPNLSVIAAWDKREQSKRLRKSTGLRLTNDPNTSIGIFNSNPSRFWNNLLPRKLAELAGVPTFASGGETLISNSVANARKKENSQLVISTEDVDLLSDLDNKRENFPAYVNVEFKADDTVPFVAAIEEAGLMNHLVTWIAAKDEKIKDRPTQTYYEPTETWDYQLSDNAQRPSLEFKGDRMNVVRTNRFTLDINDFYEAVTSESGDIPSTYNGVNTHHFNELLGCDKIKSKLLSIVLKGKLKEQFENNSETDLSDLISADLANSDTIAYKIEKRDENGELIQRVYIPNKNDQGIMRYFDTQILYGRGYQYRVYAYQAVATVDYNYERTEPPTNSSTKEYGTLYVDTGTVDDFLSEYSAGTESADNFPAFQFKEDSKLFDPTEGVGPDIVNKYMIIPQSVSITPKLKIVEVPIYAQQVMILDSPPLPPEVNVIPMKNNSTELKLFLNAQVGRRQEDPIYILEEDTDRFQVQAKAQAMQPGDYMTFESDDRPAAFQIFRLETHPVTWTDFSSALHHSVDTSLLTEEEIASGKIYGDNMYAHAASYVDTIQENKKYYYMFRTVDSHGFVSNPSEIYEVEMVNNEGAIYLLKKEVDFTSPVPKTNQKRFKRYLKICPNVQNVMVDTNKYDSAWEATSDALSLGVQSDTVWGKKFRFVIRSVKTGKEIHVDTDFTKTHIQTARENSSG